MKRNPKLPALGAILVVALTTGTYGSLSVYMAPIVEKLQTDLSKVALIFTFASISGLIISLFLGQIIKTIGIKKFIIFEGITMTVFFLSISLTNSLAAIFVGAFLFGTVTGGFGVCQTEISVWFAKGQGTLISLLSVGMGLATMILSPILSKLVLTYDVSKVTLVHGIILGLAVVLCGLFLMAEPPEKYGMNPVGYEPSTKTEGAAIPRLSVHQIIKIPAFWFIILAGGLFNFVNGGILSNAATIYQSIGVSQMQAGFCISVFNGVLLLFSPLFGAVVDKKGQGIGVFMVCLSTILGAIAAVTLSGMTGAICTAVLSSACGICASLGPICLVKAFGGAEAGSLIGFAQASGSIGQMISAPLAANVFVATGSFKPYLIMSIVATVIVYLLVVAATSKKSLAKINEIARQV